MPHGAATIKRISLPVAVLVIAGVIAVWFVMSRPQALPKPPTEKIWPVRVLDAERVDVQPATRRDHAIT